MKINLTKLVRNSVFATGMIIGLAKFSVANAALIGNSGEVTIDFNNGNPFISSNLPITIPVDINENVEVSEAINYSFFSSGFPQTLSGIASADIDQEIITISFNGTAQGGGLRFDFANLFLDETIRIVDAQVINSTGILSGVNSLGNLSFTDNSVSAGFNLFGFQPDTNVTQTIQLTFEQEVEPVSESIPESTSIFSILGIGILGITLMSKREQEIEVDN